MGDRDGPLPMKGYSETVVFNEREVRVWRRATRLVEVVTDDMRKLVRCHELVRAVYLAGRPHEGIDSGMIDGHYGAVEHSWIRLGRCILDVYAVGRLPMVQLVDVQSLGLGHRGLYRDGKLRQDIDMARVDAIVSEMKRKAA